MAVHVQPQGIDSSLRWMDRVTSSDCYGLVLPSYDSTNTVTRVSVSTSLPKPTRVDRAIEYAFTHYGDLMRRLAD